MTRAEVMRGKVDNPKKWSGEYPLVLGVVSTNGVDGLEVPGTTLDQRVAASITEAIEAGRWSPGTRLPGERDLAEEYGVSRPTIREAMIALEMKGWIEARHGSGLYVTKRDHGTGQREDALNFDVGAFDLTEARILFEGEAVALAAVSI